MSKNIVISEKDAQVSDATILSLIHDAFVEWQEQGLSSSCSLYTESDLIRLTKNGSVLVAKDFQTGDLLGVCGFDIRKSGNKKYCYCSYLAVSNESKGSGIGSRLMTELIFRCKTLGCSYIFLDTAVPASRTVRFYLKNGFKIVGLDSFRSTNYFSYLFRYELDGSSLYTSDFFCKISYFRSVIKTRLLKTKTGKTILGKLVNFFFRALRKSKRIFIRIFFRKRKALQSENEKLKYQIAYLKHHFDISQMKPATGWLRSYQIREVTYAAEILNLLKSENIQPFVIGGCLLGKVRHDGFIPFDDDIDFGIMRHDFEKLEAFCKKHFVWVDTSDFSGNILSLADKNIRENPGKYIAIKSLFCLHIYKGIKIQDALNIEFFPYDYVADAVTEKQFLEYKEYVTGKAVPKYRWGGYFYFIKKNLRNQGYTQKFPRIESLLA